VAHRVARAPLFPGALARPAIDRSRSAGRFSARDHSVERLSSSSVAGAGKPSAGLAKASSAAVTFSCEAVAERAAVWLDTDAGRGVIERVLDRSEELVRALGGRVVDVLADVDAQVLPADDEVLHVARAVVVVGPALDTPDHDRVVEHGAVALLDGS